MNRAHSAVIRACLWLAGRAAVWIIGSAAIWMAGSPRAAWGQWTTGSGGTIYYNGGNVGIGTTSPVDALHVNAACRITNPLYAGNGFSFAQDANGHLQIQYKTGASLYAHIMTMNYAGNVGVGTTNPQYKLAVNGTIGAKDIIVTNTGWPDYVFRHGYRLRPLSEVSAFIQKHRHLPDIPSEAEVKEKGVSLGNMQAKLLAKVEELTLHLIQQEKQNQDLRERLTQLENRVAANSGTAASR